MADLPRHDGETWFTGTAHPTLFQFISAARTEENLHLANEYINRVQDVKDHWGCSNDPLSAAIERPAHSCGYEELPRRIIAFYTPEDLNHYKPDGQTYLHLAVETGKITATKILLEHGADVNLRERDLNQRSPFQCAMYRNNTPELFRLLLEFGADISTTQSLAHFNPLYSAINDHDAPTRLYDAFLEAGATKAMILDTLWRLIVYSKGSPRPLNILKYLLCHDRVRPYLNAKDEQGLTLIFYSILSNSREILDLLLEAGDQPDTSCSGTNGEFTALHIALVAGKKRLEKDRQNQMQDDHPLFKASNPGIPLMCRLLESYHEAQSPWFEGITPLHLAAYIGHECELEMTSFQTHLYDPNTRGRWPTNGDFVDPTELRRGCTKPTDPYFISISAEDLDIVLANWRLYIELSWYESHGKELI